jgi:hypothetical protein
MEPTTEARAQKIAAQVLSGALRHDSPVKTWGGKGSGRPCAGCRQSICATDLEIEADFPDGQTLRFHTSCFLAWQHAAEVRRGIAEI